MSASTTVSRYINAPPHAVYRAFLQGDALASWLPPGSMRGVVHAFEGVEGGVIEMSLVYPEGEASSRGKTSRSTDTFGGRIAKLVPDEQVVWLTQFVSEDPAFAGEMSVSWTLAAAGQGTEVTVICKDIPAGIRPEDNEAGCRSSLDKLAAFVTGAKDAD
jgi:uncharacterized protein YndB with AHSA1/START domain